MWQSWLTFFAVCFYWDLSLRDSAVDFSVPLWDGLVLCWHWRLRFGSAICWQSFYTSSCSGPQVVETAESVLAAGGTPEQQAFALLEALPGFFSSALSHFGVTAAAVAGYLEGASGNAAQAVADAVSPVIVNLTGWSLRSFCS